MLQARSKAATDRLVEAEAEVSATSDALRRMGKEAKATEAKLKLQIVHASDRLENAKRELDVELEEKANLQHCVRNLQRDLEDARATRAHLAAKPGVTTSPRIMVSPGTGSGEASGENDVHLVSGGSSAFVMELEKLHLQLKQRQSEVSSQADRLRQVEEVRDALTSEVLELGQRNTELQKLASSTQKLEKKVMTITKKNNVLLELLGEKTEEVEDLQASIEQLKRKLGGATDP